MLARHAIADADWERIKNLLSTHGPKSDTRRFIDAVLFVARAGFPWRDLSERFGGWKAVWRRFDRWSCKGVWQGVFDALQDPDLEWLILDAMVMRAHPCAAKADGSGGLEDQALGRNRGGLEAKVRARVNGLGLPAKIVLNPGQEVDITHATTLLEGAALTVVIADKVYDKQEFVNAIEAKGGEAVIPSRKNRTTQRDIDGDRYKDRNLVERFWSKAKQYWWVTTRY